MEEESENEFDEKEFREAIKLNELMQEMHLKEDNEEDDLKMFDDMVKGIENIELSKK